MNKESPLRSSPLTLALIVLAIALLLFSAGTPTALVASRQGKGGTIKPIPTPTPAPKKTTTPKRSAASSNRGAATKPNESGKTAKVDASANERVFWESIRNSTDP